MTRRNLFAFACLFAFALTNHPAVGSEAQITGTATYRERIALPPNAVFEAVLQDVSRADAPAVQIGRTTIESPGNPPFEFEIGYDPAAIAPGNTYAVRASVRVDGALRFTSDTTNPVLTQDAGDHVEIIMVAVPEGEPDNAAPDGAMNLRGTVSYGADAALFTDCGSGKVYRISPEGDFAALEHAYLAAGREPGLPIVATFEGRVEEGEGSKASIVVDRFIGVWPDETCAPAPLEVGLTDTYWKLLRIGDIEILPGDGRNEAHMVLSAAEERFSATVGCNQMVGGFSREEDRLAFSQGASTMMACAPPLDAWEFAFGKILATTAHWRIDGTTLELFDASGATLAHFEAVVLD